MYACSPCIFEGFQVISCKERRPFSCLHRFLSTRKSGLGAIQNPKINRKLDWRPWCASQEHHFLEAPENRAVAKFLYVFHLCAFLPPLPTFFQVKSPFLREVGFLFFVQSQSFWSFGGLCFIILHLWRIFIWSSLWKRSVKLFLFEAIPGSPWN